MRQICLCISILLLAITIPISSRSEQEPFLSQAWVARYNGIESGWDEAWDLAIDNSGNVYVTGGEPPNGSATLKYDSDGNLLWLRRRVANGGSRAITVVTSGSVYITGHTTIKYSSSGQLVWSKPVLTSDDVRGMAIKIDQEGFVYVAGWTKDAENANDATVIKYDESGNVVWTGVYEESSPGDHTVFKSLAVDAAGNVYVAGFFQQASAVDYLLSKFNSNGEKVWAISVPGAPIWAPSEPIPILLDDSGGLYIAGGIMEIDSDYFTSDFLLAKYSTDGEPLWTRRYDGPGNRSDTAVAIALDGNSNIIVTGSSIGESTDYDFATIKYDSNGTLLWINRFDSNFGRDAPNVVKTDQDGNVYVAGGIWGEKGYALVVYAPDGSDVWTGYYGGPENAEGWINAMSLDAFGNVYVTGYSFGGESNYDFATIKYLHNKDIVFVDGFEP